MKYKLQIILSMLIFGSIGVFVTQIDLPSVALVQWRAILGTVFLGCLLMLRRKKLDFAAIRKNALPLLISGTCLGANWAFLFTAFRHISVGMATIIYYFAPILVFFIAPLLFHDKLRRAQVAGIIAAMVGMVLVNLSTLQGDGLSPAMGYAFAAAVLYAIIMLTNRFLHDINSTDSTFVQLCISAIVMTGYAYTTTGTLLHLSSPAVMGMVLVLGAVHTALAYMLFFGALPHVPSQDAAILTYIDPASALVFAFLILQERLDIWQIAGALLIFGGTIWAERKQ